MQRAHFMFGGIDTGFIRLIPDGAAAIISFIGISLYVRRVGGAVGYGRTAATD